MIIRSWRAIAGSQQVVDQYTAHLERSTFREMAALEGNLGASLSKKPIADGRFELLYLSYWKDMDAVRRFATTGTLDDAIVKPSTQKLLDSYDPKVEYFEVSGAAGLLPGELRS